MSCVSIFMNFIYFFFFNDTATTEIYTLSLHDALPISTLTCLPFTRFVSQKLGEPTERDRKSTRLNSSHLGISYAVFCLKKKKHKSIRSLIQTKNTNLISSICTLRDC